MMMLRFCGNLYMQSSHSMFLVPLCWNNPLENMHLMNILFEGSLCSTHFYVTLELPCSISLLCAISLSTLCSITIGVPYVYAQALCYNEILEKHIRKCCGPPFYVIYELFISMFTYSMKECLILHNGHFSFWKFENDITFLFKIVAKKRW